ncbi:MAG: S1C family serine protease, partial [Thermomicrobiales bacterium]
GRNTAPSMQANSSGKGFIIDADGHIVTNWHVVTGGDAFTVTLADGTKVKATLIGSDPRDDLAVVKISPSQVPDFVSLGDSSKLKPGQSVIAIGSPLGAFTNTVTDGIISGLGRNEFSSGSADCQNYSNLIQHTAPINHGNSGGPLFNLRGEVVGVNTLGLTTVGQDVVQGLFFAVPSDMVAQVVQQLIETGTIAAPYIGADLIPIDPSLNAAYDFGTNSGMYVYDIQRRSAAAKAGLRPDDIILAIDGQQITQDQTWALLLYAYKPGDTAELTVQRLQNDKWVKGTVEITFDQTPEEVFANCQIGN